MPTKVLVFESDPAFAAELRTELGHLGCATAVVEDGTAGLRQAAADKPDLILLAIELPRMNGFSVCNKLKKDASLKDVPLIIMSSESSEETFEQHRKLRTRAQDYVQKPIAFGELLRHIQAFVQLGDLAAPEGEAILIDDDIEIEDEGTQIALRPEMPKSVPPKGVDPDVDSFADAAFGRLQGSNDAGEAVGAAPEPDARKRNSSLPPKITQGELDRAKARITELEREVQTAQEGATKLRSDFDVRIEQEQHRMEREISELRSKMGAQAAKGGVSSREFLDLREALNKKDKEILSLKEGLSKKDKEIFDARDKSLGLERGKADLEDKLLATERELEEHKEKVEALARDKEQAKKAGEDFKSRFEKAKAQAEAEHKELEESKAKARADQAAHEAAAAAAKQAADERLAKAEADGAAALAKAEAEKADAIEVARGHEQEALEQAKDAAARDKAEVLAGREAELKAEREAQLAALHRAHQDELKRAQAEHAQQLEAAVAKHDAEAAELFAKSEAAVQDERRKAAEALAARDAELEAKRAADVGAAEAERDERVARAEHERDERVARAEQERDERVARAEHERDEKVAEAEKDRDERIATLEAKAAGELDAVRAAAGAEKAASDRRIAELSEELASTKTALAGLEESKQKGDAEKERAFQEIDGRLTATAKAKEDLEKELSHAKEQLAVLEAEGAATRGELAQVRDTLASEKTRADRAHSKWDQDRQTLDRAKDALAVALAQLEEAENRPI